MSSPSRPVALHEGPADSCIINGVALGWTNCTPTSFAMGLDKSTLGKRRVSGCSIRIVTGDRSGGTTIPQCAAAVDVEYGVKVEVRVGSNVATPTYLAGQLRAGRGFVAQGNAGAYVKTVHRATAGYVNHALWVNEGRGWYQTTSGPWLPTEVLVYDPAADGRKTGWGTAATSPQWWPWSLLLAFLAALRPWGDQDSRTLGSGKAYAALFPDTEPHVHLRFAGSVRTVPFPRTMTAKAAVGHRVNVRSGPSTKYPVVTTITPGARFAAYQVNPAGQLLAGSRTWYGDHNGRGWVHSSGLR